MDIVLKRIYKGLHKFRDPETSTGRQSAADENPDVEGGDHGPAVEEDAKKQLSPEGAAEEEMEIAKAELIDRINEQMCQVEGESRTSCINYIFPRGTGTEAVDILILAWPIVLTQMCGYLFQPIAAAFCGHLGNIELDAVALANSLINVTGLSIFAGMSGACDTLYSQMFGSTNRHDLGIVMQKSMILLFLIVFPCLAVHINAEALLLALKQDPQVSMLAGEYLLYFIPGLVCYSIYTALSKYVQAQNIVIPILIIALISTGIMALCHYLFIYQLQLGTIGSAISQDIGYFLMALMTFAYIIVSGLYKDTWGGWSWQCLEEWGTFFRLGFFGTVQVCVEWWTFEIGLILAGSLGTTDLAAQTIVFNTESIAYVIPYGIGTAASFRIGQHLGAENALGAKLASWAALFIGGVTATSMLLVIYFLRFHIPLIFTKSDDVIQLAGALFPIVAFYQLSDTTNAIGSGILRGKGRQHIGAVLNGIAYASALCIGVPLLLLTTIGIQAYWWSLFGAISLIAVLTLGVIFRTNWGKEVVMALDRANVDIIEVVERVDVSGEGNKNEDDYIEQAVEDAPLLTSTPSVGYGTAEVTAQISGTNSSDDILILDESKIRRGLFIKRIFTVIAVISLLFVGIAIRLTVPTTSYMSVIANSTDIFTNSTMLL